MIARKEPRFLVAGHLAASIGFGLLSASSHALVRHDAVPDVEMIQQAALFPSVGKLQGTYGTRSATLINDRWIITAAHNTPTAGQIVDFIVGGQTYRTIYWEKHPAFNISEITKGYDFAVAMLDRRVLNVVPTSIYDGADVVGSTAFIVGFGANGLASVGAGSIDGLKRAGTNIVERLPEYPNVFFTDLDSGQDVHNTLLSIGSIPNPSALEAGIAVGDSGGALMKMEDGIMRLVGIASFNGRIDGGGSGTTYGSVSGFSDVQIARSWVQAAARESGRIEGRVDLEGWTDSPLGMIVTIEVRPWQSSAVLQTVQARLDLTGRYSFVCEARGDLDIAVQGRTWLRQVKYAYVPTTGARVDFQLRNGDCDGDNVVTTFDYQVLSEAFDAVYGDARYNVRADLDGDGYVTVFDYAILSNNFDLSGDQ